MIRQKKIYCGKKCLEVDIYPYSKIQEEVSKRGKRSKRQKVTEPKQLNLNDKNAKRWFIQIINTNFGEDDLHVTLTYKPKFMPATIEEAEKESGNYMRRINYRREKKGLGSAKYIIVTETKFKNRENITEYHHHIIMDGALDRDTVEDIWCKKRQKGEKKGERIGIVNARRLQPDDDTNGVGALGAYLSKDPKGKKRWRPSRNLEKPWSINNDHKYSKREVERIVKNPTDREYWEKKYPGWTLVNNDYAFTTVYNEITGWSIYLKMRRRN